MTQLNGSGGSGRDYHYAVVTAAYNEVNYIGKLLESMVAQTVHPKRWVIVSDGSTDGTDDLVRKFAERWEFIELHRIIEDHPRNLTAQVHAINAGFARLKDHECEFVGNLDADVSFGPTYFAELLAKFSEDPTLGLAGGSICEESDGVFVSRHNNSDTSVPHAVQLFRRECLESLGGYKPFSWCGADSYAEVALRMKGWRVQSFSALQVYHHRPTGNGFGGWRYRFRGGVMDFYLGTHPLFELFRIVRRAAGQTLYLRCSRQVCGVLVGLL